MLSQDSCSSRGGRQGCVRVCERLEQEIKCTHGAQTDAFPAWRDDCDCGSLGEYTYLFCFLTFFVKLSAMQWPSSYLCFHHEAFWLSVTQTGRKKIQFYKFIFYNTMWVLIFPFLWIFPHLLHVVQPIDVKFLLQNLLALTNLLHVRIA